MRMWMLDPKLLCKKHLLGEHGEIHKHRHIFIKKYRIDKRMFPIVQIMPLKMQERHDQLVVEMENRDLNHKSPFQQPDVSYLPSEYLEAEADLIYNINDLMSRCNACKQRIISNMIFK